jgi:hypothetical protein
MVGSRRRVLLFILIFVVFYLILTLRKKQINKMPDNFFRVMQNRSVERISQKITLINRNIQTSNLTLVSAYFDIYRSERPKENYFSWLKKTFELNAPFVFFVEKKFQEEIIELIPINKQVTLITIEIEDLPYFADFDVINSILNSTEYKSKMRKYLNNIECINPLYSITIFSKSHFLKTAVDLNSFNSSKFVWVDAGISRFIGNFDVNRPILGRKLPSEKFTFILQTRAFKDRDFVEKNYKNVAWNIKNFNKAGFMGGGAVAIRNYSLELKKTWINLLNMGIVNNEQTAVILMYFEKPHLFNPWLQEMTYRDPMDDFLEYLAA